MRHYLWKNYRVTLETYNSMLVAQDGRCAICERLPEECGQQRFLHLDHCHETGTVRGLLCKACNHMLGLARDIPNVLRRAADYVERTQSQDAESDYVVEDDALLSILLNPNRTENQTNQK